MLGADYLFLKTQWILLNANSQWSIDNSGWFIV